MGSYYLLIMQKYSKINSENQVTEVVDVEDNISNPLEYLNNNHGEGNWLKTDYYTSANKHYDTNFALDGKAPFRKNHGEVGYTYDSQRDAFIPKKPFDSWVLDEETCNWFPPIPYPQDGKKYNWNESTINWTEIQST